MAELWEVSTYLLVQHHNREAICDTLRRWCNILDSAEETKDGIKQEELRSSKPVPVPIPSPIPNLDQNFNDSDIDLDMDGPGIDDDFNDEGEDGYDVDEDDETEDVIPYFATDTSANADPALASATLGSYI